MIRISRVALALSIVPIFASGKSAPSDRELIQQARRKQNAAIARHDYEAVAQRWTGTVKGAASSGTISGEYTAQWVKRGSEWLIRSEIFVALTCTGQACSWPARP